MSYILFTASPKLKKDGCDGLTTGVKFSHTIMKGSLVQRRVTDAPGTSWGKKEKRKTKNNINSNSKKGHELSDRAYGFR